MQPGARARKEHFEIAPAYAQYFSTSEFARIDEPLSELGIDLAGCTERSTVVRRVVKPDDSSALDVHVKVYSYHDNPWRRFLRPLKIAIEMRGLREFAAAGMRVPEVVGWGWKRGTLGRLEYECLVTRTEQDTVTAESYFPRTAPKPSLDEFRLDCIRRLARELRSLHTRHYYHRDFAFRNVLVRPQADGRAETIWFDSPRGIRTRLPFLSQSCQLRDLILIRFLSEAGKDEFLSHYLELPVGAPAIGRWKKSIDAFTQGR